MIVGTLFFVPLLAMVHIFSIPELWVLVVELTGWSWLMIGWVLLDVMLVAILWGYGAEIIYYHDKNLQD